MKPPRIIEQRKWVYEIILEKVPPFSWTPRGYNVALQLFLMELVGTTAAAMLSLPNTSIFYGSIAILAVWIWSLLALQIGPTVRRLKPPSAQLEREVIDNYKKSLFSPRRVELGLALLILSFISIYLSLDGRLVAKWIDGNFSPVVLFLVAILLWDISYRMGLGMWSAITAFKRSMDLSRVSGMRGKMHYTAYEELQTLKRLDLINLSFGAVTLLFYPLVNTDLVFFESLLLYSAGISLFSAISLIKIGQVPGYPQEVIWLLNEGKFGYVGTSDRKMTPHLTPVIFVFDGRTVYFVVSKISKKLRNMRENRRLAFLVDMRDPNDLYNNRAVLFMGRARVYGWLDSFLNFFRLLKIRRLFNEKYPEYVQKYKTRQELLPQAWRTTILLRRLLVSVEAQRIVYWREAHPVRLPLR